MEAVHEVSLPEMLNAREERARRQQALAEQFHLPMICFTMNIAGPVKNSALIRRGYEYGKEQLRRALLREHLSPVHEEESIAATGCECCIVLNAPPLRIKEMTAFIEDTDPMGRLFDMDVLYAEGMTDGLTAGNLPQAPSASMLQDGVAGGITEDTSGGTWGNTSMSATGESPEHRTPGMHHAHQGKGPVSMRKVDRGELGLAERKCLICGGPAKACARSRTHTVAELQRRTQELLGHTLKEADCEMIAQQACRALLYEVGTTPKPGLVDRANTGSHRDMDIYTFMSSAAALYPYFLDCARIGRESVQSGQNAAAAFPTLREAGKRAEGRMLAATGGVNTHKGAIFSMGILCAALGRVSESKRSEPDLVLNECAEMVKGIVARDYRGLTPENARTAGQRQYLNYGITGVRGQAEAGFPAVLKAGLPVLEKGLSVGLSNDRAGSAAMMAILASTDDTNMIARGGRQEQLRRKEEARTLLEDTPYPKEAVLRQMDESYIEGNLSPGGSADLLAMCWMLHFMREQA